MNQIAVGYVRISKKGDDRSVSIELQRQHIADYCKRQGFDLEHVVTHDGVSGTKRARFDALDDAVKRYRASCVVVYHLDRLARDASGLADYLKTLTRRGIQAHEVAGFGRIDTKRAIGRFVTGIRGQADQFFAEVTGEKTSAALKMLRQQGQRYTNLPPLGYRYVDGLMVEEAEEQRALEYLGECVTYGLGARRALKVLQARGYSGRQSVKCIHTTLIRLKGELDDQKVLHSLRQGNALVA